MKEILLGALLCLTAGCLGDSQDPGSPFVLHVTNAQSVESMPPLFEFDITVVCPGDFDVPGGFQGDVAYELFNNATGDGLKSGGSTYSCDGEPTHVQEHGIPCGAMDIVVELRLVRPGSGVTDSMSSTPTPGRVCPL